MKQSHHKVGSRQSAVGRPSIHAFVSIACSLLSNLLSAQPQNLPLSREWNLDFEQTRDSLFLKSDSSMTIDHGVNIAHLKPLAPCFKPYIGHFVTPHERSFTYEDFYPGVKRKLSEESLFIIKDTANKFRVTIDPLFNLEYGKDFGDFPGSSYKNTRGILVRGDIGKEFSFESSFYENQATFVKYISDFNEGRLVVPGQGRWKRFKTDGYDFAMASGYISYSPSRHFNFQAGTGKHFVGDGYRSLLLSDNAFNYPFLRITSKFGKFEYTNLYAAFMNLSDGGATAPAGTEKLFQKKAGSVQFLSWNLHKRIQLGLFQGMTWGAADSLNRMNLGPAYFHPILFFNAAQYGLRNENNILLGSTLKLKITNSVCLYGQYMLDDVSDDFLRRSIHNKQGFQAGGKYFNVLGAKGLHLQLEYSQVRPYSYAHDQGAQSYTHYSQPLAHPLGANFKETVCIVNYRIKDFFTQVKFNHGVIGKDSTGKNYGNNVFASDQNALYGPGSTINELGQGLKTTLIILDAHAGLLVNPSTNLNIILGLSSRNASNSTGTSITNFVYFGIRTSLTNVYYDF